jgi:hypothetical protein
LEKKKMMNNDNPFTLTKQNSLGKEKLSFNGVQKLVHMVVKNHPFFIQVKFDPAQVSQKVDLNKLALESQLLYDTDPLKEVAYIKVKPLESKSYRGSGENSEILTIEVKMKVLSSQLEDSLFRVKFYAIDDHTKQTLDPNWFVMTEPLKVVSKPEQIKRKKKSEKSHKVEEEKPNVTTCLRKRNRSEELSEHLAQIEAQCIQQQVLLSKLCQDASHNNQIIQQLGSGAPPPPPLPPKDKKKALTPSQQFQEVFQTFLKVSDAVPMEERPEKIRKLVHHQARRERENLASLVETFHVLIEENNSQLLGAQARCQCGTCPYQRELELIFNTDFLAAASSTFPL